MEAAEKLKISAENLNSMLATSLQKISDTRKRTKKLKAVSILRRRRKKKESKIEVPSVFKKSVSKIKNKVAGGTGNLFGNILGFVSLLLLGVAITNIEMIQEKLNDARKNLTKKLKPVINVAKVIFEGARSFISLFETKDREKEYQQLLEDIQSLEKIKKDFSKIGKNSEELEKTYKDVESGKYAKKNNITLSREGSLSDGSTYTYDADKKEYTVSTGRFKKTLTFGELARLAKSRRLFIYIIAIKPKMGPAKNEITNINNKLKFSEDTLIIFVSPHIPVETAYEMPEAVAMARIDLCE